MKKYVSTKVPRQSGFGSTSAGHYTLNPTNGGAYLISLKKGWSRRIENSGLLRIPVKRDRRWRHCSGLKSISIIKTAGLCLRYSKDILKRAIVINQPKPYILVPPQNPAFNSLQNSKLSWNFTIYCENRRISYRLAEQIYNKIN